MNAIALFSRRRLAALAALTLGTLALVPAASADRTRVSVGIGINVPPGGREFHHGRDRYYAYRGSYYRWDHGRYMRCPPPHGYYVPRLPHNSVRVVIGADTYYRADHIYYRPSRAGYEIVEVPVAAPVVRYDDPVADKPIGTPIRSNDKLVAVWLDDTRYLLDDGQYFKMGSQGRVWVPTPIGATVKELPIGAITVWHEENEYFEFDGGYFRRSPDGFKVVTAPWEGAEVSVADAASAPSE